MRYPKRVVLFPGVLAVARNEAEHRRLVRADAWCVGLFAAGMLALAVWLLCAVLWP